MPADVDAALEPIQTAYRRSWDLVVREERALIAHPELLRRRARLNAMRARIEAEMDRIDAKARAWIKANMPLIYEAGAVAALAATGGGELRWTMIHREAVQQLSGDLFDDLLRSTRLVRRTTKDLIRTVARDQALQRAITGLDTTVSASRRMAAIIEERGIHAVRYRNGARHGLREYAEMSLRTKSSVAYNTAALNSVDTPFWECMDGPSCGLTSHDDPTTANGMVADRDTALAYPVSHPSCRRTWAPRVDVTSKAEAERARPTTTSEQNAAQRVQDAERRDQQRRRTLRRQRDARRAERMEALAARQRRRAARTS